MNFRKGIIVWFPIVFASCAVVPHETVTLSRKLGEDLKILHTSHVNAIDLQFNRMVSDINSFIDGVYGPYVIHHVLSSELTNFNDGKPSIYGAIETAGKTKGKKESDIALSEMSDFLIAAKEQIEEKRTELLTPVLTQKEEILKAINQSSENLIYANATITGHLESIRKVKEAQQDALKAVGLQHVDEITTNTLVQASDNINKAIQAGKKIDVQSDKALDQLNDVGKKIKSAFNKKELEK